MKSDIKAQFRAFLALHIVGWVLWLVVFSFIFFNMNELSENIIAQVFSLFFHNILLYTSLFLSILSVLYSFLTKKNNESLAMIILKFLWNSYSTFYNKCLEVLEQKFINILLLS